MAAAAAIAGLLLLFPVPSRAQTGEDVLGTWLIYNGTIRFSPKWSIFTEGQIRLWEVASNINEALARAALHYDFPNSQAMVGLGYLRQATWPYIDTGEGREKIENRIYEQFGLQQRWLRAHFDHRYRLEQRWLKGTSTGTTTFSIRTRYRIQVTTPLNRGEMEPGAWFLNFYDEIFITFDSERSFDQNRLYGAGGYQFTPLANLQVGMLWKARPTLDFWRLQIFYTHNFDLSEG